MWPAAFSRTPAAYVGPPLCKSQWFSGTKHFPLFGGCPTKNGLPPTGEPPFFSRVAEQLSAAAHRSEASSRAVSVNSFGSSPWGFSLGAATES